MLVPVLLTIIIEGKLGTFFNHYLKLFKLEVGDRIVQLILEKIAIAEVIEVENCQILNKVINVLVQQEKIIFFVYAISYLMHFLLAKN